MQQSIPTHLHATVDTHPLTCKPIATIAIDGKLSQSCNRLEAYRLAAPPALGLSLVSCSLSALVHLYLSPSSCLPRLDVQHLCEVV